MEFNKNYLGHKFVKLKKYGFDCDYICNFCGVEVMYEIIKDEENYYIVEDADTVKEILNIDCNNFIVKNIIE